MRTKEEKKADKLEVDKMESHIANAGSMSLGASEVALGVMSGAVVGAMAGPIGALAGALIGGAAGAGAAVVSTQEATRDDERQEGLDAEIGVSGGEMGAPNLKHPPSQRGTYSAVSAGISSGGGVSPAEGPTPPPED